MADIFGRNAIHVPSAVAEYDGSGTMSMRGVCGRHPSHPARSPSASVSLAPRVPSSRNNLNSPTTPAQKDSDHRAPGCVYNLPMTPDQGWLPFAKLLLGYLLLLTLAVLAGLIALGKVEGSSSFGLEQVLGGLLVLAGAFSHWAFGENKEK